jgi:hypothetical protein
MKAVLLSKYSISDSSSTSYLVVAGGGLSGGPEVAQVSGSEVNCICACILPYVYDGGANGDCVCGTTRQAGLQCNWLPLCVISYSKVMRYFIQFREADYDIQEETGGRGKLCSLQLSAARLAISK